MCAQQCLRAACYLKVQAAIDGLYPMCKYIMKNCLLLEKQVEYVDQIEELWSYVDLSYDDENRATELKYTIPWYKYIENIDDNIYKLPTVTSLPRWEVKIGVDKPTKMDLCFLDPPSTQNRVKLQALVDKFLEKLDLPENLIIPNEEELVQPSLNKNYSNGEIMTDNEINQHQFGPFLYQECMTGWNTPREIWLPCPEVKRMSKFWHIIGSKIIGRIPYNCLLKSDEQIFEYLRDKLCPIRTLDLKGSGLQFPREYVLVVMESLTRLYPELEDWYVRCKHQFDEYNVIQGDFEKKPPRGLGLGYFTELKSLVVWSILDGLDILASFDDDMLIKEDSFEEAKERLTSFEFVLNEKKTGQSWKNVVYFLEAAISEDGICYTHKENSGVSAIFLQRFHYERKLLCSELPKGMQHIISYHLERIYGKEFYRGEAFSHINDGGYLSSIGPELGWSRGLYACYFPVKKTKAHLWKISGLEPSEKFTLEERKFIHRNRKERWKTKQKRFASDFYILHTSTSLYEEIYTPDLMMYEYPSWAEEILLKDKITGGSITGDLISADVIEALVQCGNEREPIHSYIGGLRTPQRMNFTFSDELREKYFTAMESDKVEHLMTFIRRAKEPRFEIEIKKDKQIEYPSLEFYTNPRIYNASELLRSELESPHEIGHDEITETSEIDDLDELYLQSSEDTDSNSSSEETL